MVVRQAQRMEQRHSIAGGVPSTEPTGNFWRAAESGRESAVKESPRRHLMAGAALGDRYPSSETDGAAAPSPTNRGPRNGPPGTHRTSPRPTHASDTVRRSEACSYKFTTSSEGTMGVSARTCWAQGSGSVVIWPRTDDSYEQGLFQFH